MQASELCQKVLVSLKADLRFKVDVRAMGSTFPSAGTRNENLFTCMRRGPFPIVSCFDKTISQSASFLFRNLLQKISFDKFSESLIWYLLMESVQADEL